MIFLIFAADKQKRNKGSIKKASSFPRFSFYSETNLQHQMIVAFGGQVCIPPKNVQECVEKCTVMAVKSYIIVSLLSPNEKMTMY